MAAADALYPVRTRFTQRSVFVRRMNIDTVFRVKMPYRAGQLARIAAAIAEEQGLIGELHVVRMSEVHTIRDITVETETAEQTKRVEARLRSLDGIEVLATTDAVFSYHEDGKIHMRSRHTLQNVSDLRKAYTPGVALVASAIHQDPSLAYRYTALGQSVGIFTNGTRVLGLGDIGPTAAMPVMEGKAMLYDQCVGISAVPLVIQENDPKAFVETVVRLAPSFGGIHLEDIRSPDCYWIEDELMRRLNQPVMHDDQHGTAVAALAGLFNACRMAGLPLQEAVVGQVGLGAAGSAIARLILALGVKRMLVSDRNPNAVAWMEKLGAHGADLSTLMQRCDVVLAATGKPGLIRAQDVRKGQILFALSNPAPEIDPALALQAGAAFASDGRSINNALAYPGIFRGALQARARCISNGMKLAAARAIAHAAEPGELVPDPLDPRVHQAVVHAVIQTAEQEGVAYTATPWSVREGAE